MSDIKSIIKTMKASKPKEPTRKRYSIYVLKDVYEALDRQCKANGLGVSKLVEELMEAALNEFKK